MLVEFYGVPAAGKSTLSRHVAALLLQRGFAVDEPTHVLHHRSNLFRRQILKLRHFGRFALQNPDRIVSAAVLIARTRQRTWADYWTAFTNWIVIASIVSRPRAPGRITLLDQGIAQALWSVAFAAGSEAMLGRLAHEVRRGPLRPDLIVHVRASLGAVERRLAKRAGKASRLERAAGGTLALPERLRQNESILHYFREQGCSVLDIDSDDPDQLQSSAEHVVSSILELLGRGVNGAKVVVARHEASAEGRHLGRVEG